MRHQYQNSDCDKTHTCECLGIPQIPVTIDSILK